MGLETLKTQNQVVVGEAVDWTLERPEGGRRANRIDPALSKGIENHFGWLGNVLE
jgi:hypothetical protein